MSRSKLETIQDDVLVSALAKAIRGDKLVVPLSEPTIRIAFQAKPSWSDMARVRGFQYDAIFVFRQRLRVTDANYGCLEVDFTVENTDRASLQAIEQSIKEDSDFDLLALKYRITQVRLFNFPSSPTIPLTVDYDL